VQKRAVAIRHVHFEDLGLFETVLAGTGYALNYCDIGIHNPAAIDKTGTDLLLVLGAPIGANDVQTYPFLAEELALLSARLKADRPTFGICLGAQLMARALGAPVAPMGHKEIGFSELALTETGQKTPLRHLAGVSVLHWHGDAFAIPEGAVRLAFTPKCANQAFSLSPRIMGVQFHPEADASSGLERWLIGHAAELDGARIDPRELRRDAGHHGAALAAAGRAFFTEWLAGLA
jgi:GMP synthase (glutamine-hydrolysing)